jgi:type I restriction enzyme S subunit
MTDVDDLWDLPEGWVWAEFCQVAQVASNLVDPADFPDSPHIAPNHIESGTGRLLSYTTVAEDKVTSSKHRFFPGQILYSKIRPNLCKAVLIDFNGLCSADMYPVNSLIDSRFLHRWMITSAFTDMASSHDGRTLLPKINQEALALLNVPVPPLAEQKRISQVLEQIIEVLAKSSVRLEHAAALLGYKLVPSKGFSLAQSVLAKAFKGELVPTEAELAEKEGRGFESGSELIARLNPSSNGVKKRTRGKKSAKRTASFGESLPGLIHD